MSAEINALTDSVAALLDSRGRAVIAIDGYCGSGKSGLARSLAERFPACVFHTDDFYLPMERRCLGWERVPAGNMDLLRLRGEVLDPASIGHTVLYRQFTHEKGTGGAQLVPPRPLVIVEGSYCLHPLLRPFYDLSVFLRCSDGRQLDRIESREGAKAEDFKERWIPMERIYHRAFSLPRPEDMVIDTTDLF